MCVCVHIFIYSFICLLLHLPIYLDIRTYLYNLVPSPKSWRNLLKHWAGSPLHRQDCLFSLPWRSATQLGNLGNLWKPKVLGLWSAVR